MLSSKALSLLLSNLHCQVFNYTLGFGYRRVGDKIYKIEQHQIHYTDDQIETSSVLYIENLSDYGWEVETPSHEKYRLIRKGNSKL